MTRRYLQMAAAGLAAAALAALPGPATALEGTFSVQIENDLFAPRTNTDRHYTSGLRASYLSTPLDDLPGWLTTVTSLPSAFVPGGSKPVKRQFGFAVGHSLFTPDDTTQTGLIADDRPYAAWLYMSLALVTTHQATAEDSARQDTFQVDLGVVGPYAFGEQIQNNYHTLIGVDEANGWDNQINNEPGINLIFERKWRTERQKFFGDALEADFIPYLNFSLGNVWTFAGAGALVRFSTDLLDDFGPATVRPGLPGSESFETGGEFGWYAFVGASGRAVLRDVFLDGNLLSTSHSVDKRNLVADIQFGLAVAIGNARIAYTHVFRSPEFEMQGDFDQFGSLSLTWRFGG